MAPLCAVSSISLHDSVANEPLLRQPRTSAAHPNDRFRAAVVLAAMPPMVDSGQPQNVASGW
jgi:hypothetical protein